MVTEVDKICDRIGIIRNGNLVALEDVETLKSKMGKMIRVRIKEKPEMFKGPENTKIKDSTSSTKVSYVACIAYEISLGKGASSQKTRGKLIFKRTQDGWKLFLRMDALCSMVFGFSPPLSK